MSAVTLSAHPLRENTLRIVEELDRDVYWMYMHSRSAENKVRTCFSSEMLDDTLQFQAAVRRQVLHRSPVCSFVVIGSDSDVFSLGGDLASFIQLIRRRDRTALMSYAKRCIECVHGFHNGCHAGARSIALIQGQALGGGFEVALSCHTIIAEEGALLGFPEVIFNLFPGMGAYSYMRQRVSLHLAERLMCEGKMYSAEELHAMGLIDYVVPTGMGMEKVEYVINQTQHTANAWQAIQKSKQYASPVAYGELMSITEVWVDAAMQLDDKALRAMERLVRAQDRRHGV